MLNGPVVGVAVIVAKSGRVLVGKRKSSHGTGTWQFPGGHLEFGESIDACAHREVSEETGITITNLRMGPFTNDIFEMEAKHYVTLFVLADHKAGVPQVLEPEKCDTWKWVIWGEFPSPRFLPIENLLQQDFTPF